MKIRINDLARELEIKSKEILDALPELGIMKKTHSSPIEDHEADKVRRHFAAKLGPATTQRKIAPAEIRPKIDFSKIHKPGDVLRQLKEREQRLHLSTISRPTPHSAVRSSVSSEIKSRIDLPKDQKPGDIFRVPPNHDEQPRLPIMNPPAVVRSVSGADSAGSPLRLKEPLNSANTGSSNTSAKNELQAQSVVRLEGTGPSTAIASAGSSLKPVVSQTLVVPRKFTFHRKFIDFDYVLSFFDWSLKNVNLLVDLSSCESANYQALALLIQYAWYLSLNGCTVTFKYGMESSGPTKMLRNMGATDWPDILTTDGRDFGNNPGKKTYALRRRSDVSSTMNGTRRALENYTIGFPEYLSYIISELLYNATEHGQRAATLSNCIVRVPAIFQFGRYPMSDRLAFLFSDLGVGIKAHLEQAYSAFPTHQEAITYALNPNISGTFGQQSNPYASRDNAGMGLTYSSSMLKRLKGDMYIVSHNGMVHISPEDITSKTLKHPWNGTFVFIDLNVSDAPPVSVKALLAEIQAKAQKEIDDAREKEQSTRYSINIYNYFGKWAEDKDRAITFRDRHLIPAIEAGKKLELDFRDVETAPHSFLNALLATPVRLLGLKAYQWIRVCNAPGTIHEIINTVIASNLPEME